MVAKLLLQNLIWVAAMGALLLVPAGTPHGGVGVPGHDRDARAIGRIVASQDRSGLFAERMHPMMLTTSP
jgi:hypothetical protein